MKFVRMHNSVNYNKTKKIHATHSRSGDSLRLLAVSGGKRSYQRYHEEERNGTRLDPPLTLKLGRNAHIEGKRASAEAKRSGS